MPPFLTAKTMGLPRWAWGAMLVGGVAIGLYLRMHHSKEAAGTEISPEGYLNSGNLMPPGAPIEGGGGGASGGGATERAIGAESEKPPEEHAVAPTAEEVELPESKPPLEPVVESGGGQPSKGGAQPVRGETIGGAGISENKPVAPPANKQEREKIHNEITRLQGEIDGLQNHITQLTAVIQAHPNAKQRGQWEAERNQDRANIEHKRSEMYYWSAQ